jgi:phosphoserine aminotransferase
MVAWESFGEGWVTDVVKQLKLEADVRKSSRPMASCPTSRHRPVDRRRLHLERHHLGVRVPNADWIPTTAKG